MTAPTPNKTAPKPTDPAVADNKTVTAAPAADTEKVEDHSRSGPPANFSPDTVQPLLKQGDPDGDETEAPKPARINPDSESSAIDRFHAMVAAYPQENDGRTIVIGYANIRLSINDLREVAGLPVVL